MTSIRAAGVTESLFRFHSSHDAVLVSLFIISQRPQIGLQRESCRNIQLPSRIPRGLMQLFLPAMQDLPGIFVGKVKRRDQQDGDANAT